MNKKMKKIAESNGKVAILSNALYVLFWNNHGTFMTLNKGVDYSVYRNWESRN